MIEPSGSSRQNQVSFSTRFVCYFALVVLTCFVASLEPACADSSPALTVRVYNYARTPQGILVSAEREANRLLNNSGSRIIWLDCLQIAFSPSDKMLCDSGWSADLPSVRILSAGASRQFQDLDYGFAAIPVLVTISYDR